MLSSDSCSCNTGLTVRCIFKTASTHALNAHENYSSTHFCRKTAKNKVIYVIISGHRGKEF